MKNNSKISVIIPVYNEARSLRVCIRSLLNQSKNVHEIILVDDGSTDNSVSCIQEIINQNPQQKFILKKQLHQGPAKARNLGAKLSSGSLLLFLDADMHFSKNYIKNLTQPILMDKEVATTNGSERVSNMDNIWARYWDLVTYNQNGFRIAPSDTSRDLTMRAIRADYFHKSGGYDSFGHSDDSTLLKKLGISAKLVRSAVSYHRNPETLVDVFYSARWIGRDSQTPFLPGIITFSLPWSLVKSTFFMIRHKRVHAFLFRVIFDIGIWIGLLDQTFSTSHYK